MRLLLISLSLASVTAEPGLLKVPKVYNALITTDQNLSPSRAFPVLQPIVHRTAVGYIPPFYYTQIPPHVLGPVRTFNGQVQVQDNYIKDANLENPEGRDSSQSLSVNKENKIPLRFYPNYQSLNSDPYFYTYGSHNSNSFLDINQENDQDQVPLEPQSPQNTNSDRLSPSLPGEKFKNRGDRIPDVPPPAIPILKPSKNL